MGKGGRVMWVKGGEKREGLRVEKGERVQGERLREG